MKTVNEVATMFGVSTEQVRRWLRNGDMIGKPKSKRGNWEIDESEIERFLQFHPKYLGIVSDLPIYISSNHLSFTEMWHSVEAIQHELDKLKVSLLLAQKEGLR